MVFQIFSRNFWGLHVDVFGILIALLSFLSLLIYWRGWARQAFGDDKSETGSRPRWPLRPSNLLILLAAGLYLYQVLQLHRYSIRESWAPILVLLAVIIRYWENDALRDVDVTDADVEDARAELEKAKEKRKARRLVIRRRQIPVVRAWLRREVVGGPDRDRTGQELRNRLKLCQPIPAS